MTADQTGRNVSSKYRAFFPYLSVVFFFLNIRIYFRHQTGRDDDDDDDIEVQGIVLN